MFQDFYNFSQFKNSIHQREIPLTFLWNPWLSKYTKVCTTLAYAILYRKPHCPASKSNPNIHKFYTPTRYLIKSPLKLFTLSKCSVFTTSDISRCIIRTSQNGHNKFRASTSPSAYILIPNADLPYQSATGIGKTVIRW